MQYGDLSNQRGPAIVINADLLVILKKKLFGLSYELNFLLSTRHLLEHWFTNGDLAIYIVCIGEHAKRMKQITDMLDTFMTPYTRIIEIKTAEELNYLVSAEYIVGYFYNSTSSNLINFRSNIGKYYQVPNVAEISYWLDGGAKK